MLFKEIIAVYSEDHMEPIYTLWFGGNYWCEQLFTSMKSIRSRDKTHLTLVGMHVTFQFCQNVNSIWKDPSCLYCLQQQKSKEQQI
jgi:hypothetical protein